MFKAYFFIFSSTKKVTNYSYNDKLFTDKKAYDISETTSRQIIIEHLDHNNKIIADSKYYMNPNESTDYRQMFYLQHIATEYNKDIKNYVDRVIQLIVILTILLDVKIKMD